MLVGCNQELVSAKNHSTCVPRPIVTLQGSFVITVLVVQLQHASARFKVDESRFGRFLASTTIVLVHHRIILTSRTQSPMTLNY